MQYIDVFLEIEPNVKFDYQNPNMKRQQLAFSYNLLLLTTIDSCDFIKWDLKFCVHRIYSIFFFAFCSVSCFTTLSCRVKCDAEKHNDSISSVEPIIL